eukprot:TRINITY_DN317_c0_g3_i1.p1 TRINITY_DN317_c0_g3~~TRINITY_DN317_c0_g3_i1.p1  ORF type:complete len:290 (+),score=43.25 TRINITY_DN317_c0_g3_i1:65-934(+)
MPKARGYFTSTRTPTTDSRSHTKDKADNKSIQNSLQTTQILEEEWYKSTSKSQATLTYELYHPKPNDIVLGIVQGSCPCPHYKAPVSGDRILFISVGDAEDAIVVCLESQLSKGSDVLIRRHNGALISGKVSSQPILVPANQDETTHNTRRFYLQNPEFIATGLDVSLPLWFAQSYLSPNKPSEKTHLLEHLKRNAAFCKDLTYKAFHNGKIHLDCQGSVAPSVPILRFVATLLHHMRYFRTQGLMVEYAQTLSTNPSRLHHALPPSLSQTFLWPTSPDPAQSATDSQP